MSRRLFPFAELMLFAGILASGYVIVASTTATAIPVAATTRSDKPTAREAANPAALAPPPAPPTRISSAKPPVPLRTSRHPTYWSEDPKPPPAATEGAVAAQTEKRATSDAAAKAMIEADGYKNVSSLVQRPDGSWRGLAMRGAVEVAISLEADGRVLAD